jgi:ferric-dicitrate binding protein FerR (iron transport regulator)
MNKNRDTAWARYLAGEMSPAEEIAFRKNLESEPRQMNDLRAMERTWKQFDQDGAFQHRDSAQGWNQLHRRLEKDGLLDEPPYREHAFMQVPFMRFAAVILLVIAMGIPAVYFGFFHNQHTPAQYSQSADKGVHTVDLPDGSRVFMNEGATITYPDDFTEERSVRLEGEAYFEVMSDPMNPFTVRSGKIIVSVLGTSFNIKPSDVQDEKEVYVETGQVRVSLDHSSHTFTLNPGELGRTSHREMVTGTLNDANYLSWKTKEFKFVEADLMEVLLELEESYHVRIHTENIEPSQMKITTSYSEQSIDAILETIGAAFGLNVSFREDGYYLSN